MIKTVLRNIDFAKLSGVTTITGVDISGECMRVVVLRKKNSPLNKYSARFVPLRHLMVESLPGDSMEERGKKLRAKLDGNKIRSPWAVSSINTHGAVKTVTVDVPKNVTDVRLWIVEQYEKLVRLPLPISELMFEYEKVEGGDGNRSSIEITFVRRSEVDQYRQLFHAAGLTLLRLSAGVREAFFSIYLDASTDKDVSFLYLKNDTLHVTELRGDRSEKRRGPTRQIPLDASVDRTTVIRTLIGDGSSRGMECLVVGETMRGIAGFTAVTPFGLSTEYTLAVGLALKGFLPELSPVDFLSDAASDESRNKIRQSFSRRLTITFGGILILLFGIQFCAQWYLDGWERSVDDQLAVDNGKYVEIFRLESEVNSLKQKMANGRVSYRNTDLARSLHELAVVVPEGVRLYKAVWNDTADGQFAAAVQGFADSEEDLGIFLKRMERSSVFSHVNLIRSGTPLAANPVVPVIDSERKHLYFEINFTSQ